MKRRTIQGRSRRARKLSRSPYAKRNKKPYKYPFPTGVAFLAHRDERGYDYAALSKVPWRENRYLRNNADPAMPRMQCT